MELGHKFPREPKALTAVLGRFGLDARLRLVFGRAPAPRSAEDELAALRPHLDLLKAMGCKVLIFAETSNAIHGDRAKPLDERPVLAPGEWREFGRRMTAVGDCRSRRGAAARLPPSHGHGGRDRGRHRRLHGRDRALGASPPRHRARDLRRRRPGGARPPPSRRASAHVHTKDVRADVMATRHAPRACSFLDAVIAGVFTVPGDGCVDYPAVLARACRAISAGSWSRPSRIRKRRIPSPMPGWATPTCGATSTRRGSREHDGEASPQARRRPRPHP